LPQCEYCGREFTTEQSLAQHLKDKHPQEQAPAPPEGRSAPQQSRPEKKRRPLRRRNRHPVAIGVLAIAVVVGGYLVAAPYLAPPPFPYITGDTYIHVHPWVQIWINGMNVTIPCGVGTENGICNGGTYEPVHTHDSSGVLHIELSQSDAGSHNYTLADLFTVWKWSLGTVQFNGTSHPIVFSPTDLLGYTTDATHRIYLLVDGKNSTAWGSLNLEQLDYCNAAIGANPPCATADGNPYWDGGASYPYGTGHKIVIEYVTV
jgi:hypothetical protein